MARCRFTRGTVAEGRTKPGGTNPDLSLKADRGLGATGIATLRVRAGIRLSDAKYVLCARHRPLSSRTAVRPQSANRTKPVEVRVCATARPVELGLYGARHHTADGAANRCIAEAGHPAPPASCKRTLVARGRQLLRALRLLPRPIIALHFHHVDPTTKSFPMSTASGKSIAAYREEAKKCVLVCANCHCEIEAGIVDSPPPGTTFE